MTPKVVSVTTDVEGEDEGEQFAILCSPRYKSNSIGNFIGHIKSRLQSWVHKKSDKCYRVDSNIYY